MRLDSTGIEEAVLRRRLPKLGHFSKYLPETSNRFSLRFSGSFVDGVSGAAGSGDLPSCQHGQASLSNESNLSVIYHLFLFITDEGEGGSRTSL